MGAAEPIGRPQGDDAVAGWNGSPHLVVRQVRRPAS